MKVWITKYALSSGVFTVDAEESNNSPGIIIWNTAGSWAPVQCAIGKDWWRTKADAEKRVQEMRQKKISSLKKQLAKFETTAIEVPE